MDSLIAYCLNCDKDVECTTITERGDTEIRGTKISFIEVIPKCPVCGEVLYVAEINDANVRTREEAYRKAAHLITIKDVQEILATYQIGAGPLAKILGVGEITINRYLLGQLPSREISDKLYNIMTDRKMMRECLEKNKDKITSVAYRKCIEALNQLDELYCHNKVDIIARYILVNNFDITPLGLQKLLYYSQSFYHALFCVDLFTDDCQAWEWGPVYPVIYNRYKDCDSEFSYTFQVGTDFSDLTEDEKSFLDAVLDIFGKYSGITLSQMTYSEKPWITARGNLRPDDKCSNIIDRNEINEYFDSVVKKYGIKNPSDMKKYCDAMIE